MKINQHILTEPYLAVFNDLEYKQNQQFATEFAGNSNRHSARNTKIIIFGFIKKQIPNMSRRNRPLCNIRFIISEFPNISHFHFEKYTDKKSYCPPAQNIPAHHLITCKKLPKP